MEKYCLEYVQDALDLTTRKRSSKRKRKIKLDEENHCQKSQTDNKLRGSGFKTTIPQNKKEVIKTNKLTPTQIDKYEESKIQLKSNIQTKVPEESKTQQTPQLDKTKLEFQNHKSLLGGLQKLSEKLEKEEQKSGGLSKSEIKNLEDLGINPDSFATLEPKGWLEG